MFKKILVPTDGSPLSEKAARMAVDFAKVTDAQIATISIAVPYLFVPPYAAGMFPDPGFYSEDLQRMHDEQSFKLAHVYVQNVSDLARDEGIPCEKLTAVSRHPHEEIVSAIDKFGCDVVFMASHGRKGLNKFFLGSETQKVLAASSVPVMVIR